MGKIGGPLQPLAEREPHFQELEAYFTRLAGKRTKADIFRLWARSIAPDRPRINEQQFISWTRNAALKRNAARRRVAAAAGGETGAEVALSEPFRQLVERRRETLSEIEEHLRGVTGTLLAEAESALSTAAEVGEPLPLRERYFTLALADKVWGKVQKEKEIGIKAHHEKRESVGMFAKLLRGALSGECTVEDVRRMGETYAADAEPAEAAR